MPEAELRVPEVRVSERGDRNWGVACFSAPLVGGNACAMGCVWLRASSSFMVVFVCGSCLFICVRVCITAFCAAEDAWATHRSIGNQAEAPEADLNGTGGCICPTSGLQRAFRRDAHAMLACNIWLNGIRYFAGHDSLESCVQIVSDVSPALDREIKLRMVCAWNARFANLCAALVAIRHSMSMQDKNLQLWWLCKAWAVARG